MRRRRRTDERVDVIVLEMTDGTRLRGSVADVGRASGPYWAILDNSGAQYIGPPARGDRKRELVEKAIRAWWDARHTKKPDQSHDAG